MPTEINVHKCPYCNLLSWFGKAQVINKNGNCIKGLICKRCGGFIPLADQGE